MAASGANTEMSYVPEAVQGVTPNAPAMKTLRTTGRNINTTRGLLRSAERRKSRMRRSVRLGFKQGAGGLPFELGLGDFDDIIEMALSGTWAPTTTGATNLDMTPTGPHRDAGSFVTDGFMVGDIVAPAGFTNAGNNMQRRILALTATDITFEDTAGLVVEASGGGRSIASVGTICKVGSVLRTMTVERRFTDIGLYQQFTGVAVNGLTVNVTPQSIIGGTMDLLAMDGTKMLPTTLGAPAPTTDNEPFDAFTGSLYEGGVEIGTATGLTFTLANNRSLNAVLMKKTSPQVFEGEVDLTGTLTVHFEDASICNKFDDETEAVIDLRLDDLGGTDFHRIVLPRVKYTGWGFDPPASGPITIPMTFEALEDPITRTNIAWQRSNA